MLATLFLSVSLAADPLPIRLPELAVPTPMPRPASAVSKLAADAIENTARPENKRRIGELR